MSAPNLLLAEQQAAQVAIICLTNVDNRDHVGSSDESRIGKALSLDKQVYQLKLICELY